MDPLSMFLMGKPSEAEIKAYFREEWDKAYKAGYESGSEVAKKKLREVLNGL